MSDDHDGAVTLVTKVSVKPDCQDEFAAWQQRIAAIVVDQPGYISHQTTHPPTGANEWLVIQRFATAADARAWLGSPRRATLVTEAQHLLDGPDDTWLVAADHQPAESMASAIIATSVAPGREAEFRRWRQRVAAAQAAMPGYRGVRLEPPVPGLHDDWLTLLRFDTQAHLDAWLNGETRRQLMAEGQAFVAASSVSTTAHGFEFWFKETDGGADAPLWKQNMIVLLVLYPVVFLFGRYVQQPFLVTDEGLPFWLALFIGNVASVAVTGYFAIGWASRRLNWWLNPAPALARRNTLIGTALVLALYAAMLAVAAML